MPINFAHAHLVLTHFPPVLSLMGMVSAVAGALRRRTDLMHLSLILLIVVGAMMPLVYFAGDRASRTIGRVEGVQQEAIAPHQHAATIALATAVSTAVVACLVLFIQRKRHVPASLLIPLVIAISLASTATIGWAAALGGAIHHPETAQKADGSEWRAGVPACYRRASSPDGVSCDRHGRKQPPGWKPAGSRQGRLLSIGERQMVEARSAPRKPAWLLVG
jgi:hypothetical protein